ncbi:hypothetical protein BC826DRAFT_603415 [Russula brevipes]|nr:hypothetical protein BC826DRAFT_603415 [Russula brevipes]
MSAQCAPRRLLDVLHIARGPRTLALDRSEILSLDSLYCNKPCPVTLSVLFGSRSMPYLRLGTPDVPSVRGQAKGLIALVTGTTTTVKRTTQGLSLALSLSKRIKSNNMDGHFGCVIAIAGGGSATPRQTQGSKCQPPLRIYMGTCAEPLTHCISHLHSHLHSVASPCFLTGRLLYHFLDTPYGGTFLWLKSPLRSCDPVHPPAISGTKRCNRSAPRTRRGLKPTDITSSDWIYLGHHGLRSSALVRPGAGCGLLQPRMSSDKHAARQNSHQSLRYLG